MFSMSAETRKHGVTINWPSFVSAVAFAAVIAACSPYVGGRRTGEVTDCPIFPPDVIKLSTTDRRHCSRKY